jgi:hypothetical protein
VLEDGHVSSRSVFALRSRQYTMAPRTQP